MKRIQKIELAKTLYFKSDKTQKEICDVVGWSENTFTRHKKKECWDEQKAVNILTNEQIISELRIQAKRITDNAKTEKRILTVSEVDSISKIASSIEKLSSKLTHSQVVEVAMSFLDWLKNGGLQSEAIEFVGLFDSFLKYILTERD